MGKISFKIVDNIEYLSKKASDQENKLNLESFHIWNVKYVHKLIYNLWNDFEFFFAQKNDLYFKSVVYKNDI